MPTSLFVEKASHVADVVVRTPGKGNALGPDFWRELPETFVSLDADADVRAIVLRADGPHFTFGLDLISMMGELGGALSGGLADARTKLHETILRLQASVSSIARCRKPVIAAITGLRQRAMEETEACRRRIVSCSLVRASASPPLSAPPSSPIIDTRSRPKVK